MKMPSCAPRPHATTSAAGVARPSAHGHAMISTASAALTACSAGLPAASHPGQGQRDRGQRHQRDEHPADPVGQPLDARLVRLRPLDQGDQVRELGVLTGVRGAAISRPLTTTVPAVTALPTATSAGTDFAGHHAGVHRGLAELHHPVGGDRLPGPDHHRVTRPQLPARDPPLGPVAGRTLASRAPGRGQLGASPPRRRAAPRPQTAAGQQEHGHRRRDLQVDPAAGGVPQQHCRTLIPACPRSRTNIA